MIKALSLGVKMVLWAGSDCVPWAVLYRIIAHLSPEDNGSKRERDAAEPSFVAQPIPPRRE